MTNGALQGTEPDVLAPLCRDRVERQLKAMDWRYFIDSDGDLGSVWGDNDVFYFLLRGDDDEILHIQAMWHQTMPIERLGEVRDLIDQWNLKRLWPKGSHRISDEGRIRVFEEVSVDWEPGVSDHQILQQIRCSLGTTSQFFEMLQTELSV